MVGWLVGWVVGWLVGRDGGGFSLLLLREYLFLLERCFPVRGFDLRMHLKR